MAAEGRTIRSACECQAALFASLDEQRLVLAGWAVRGTQEHAPAITMAPRGELFDVGWQCPFCGRNVLRTFHAGALRKTAA